MDHGRGLLHCMLRLLPSSALLSSMVWCIAAARACSLNGVPSLEIDGHLATIAQGTATQASLATWAPFTLPAAAVGATVHFQEDLAGVRQSLSPASLATPFRWSFGDGTHAHGYRVTHQYSRLGVYRLTVSYRWLATQRWVVFDSASLQVVAPGDLWRANLRYYLAQDSQLALRVLLWTGAAASLTWFAWTHRTALRRRAARR